MLNEIEDLSQLLKQRLGNDKEIVKQIVSRLTAPGDNYGSIMLAVKVELKSTNSNETEELNIVAKIPPPTEFMQEMFNTPVTFKNEIFFYKNLLPALKDFTKAEGFANLLNCFPEYYGSRSSLNPESDQVDGNAVLLLNNLKISNFGGGDRTVGFDLASAKLIVRDLAEMHAVPLAMKLKKPEEFREKIMKIMTQYKTFNLPETMQDEIIENSIISVIEDAGISKEYEPRIREGHLRNKQPAYVSPKNSPEYLYEPFSTLIHTDAWVNNFMLKFENGEPVKSKIVDFQMYEYGNPGRDVIFFLFTSVQDDVLVNNFDELVGVYHERLIEILELFKCDIAPFSMEKFQIELKRAVELFELLHCYIMLRPIFATKDDIKELHEYSEEDMTKSQVLSDQCKRRMRLMTEELIKRKWI